MTMPPEVRRADKRMTDDEALAALEAGFCGRLGTVGPDGWPYVVPLLYVWMDGRIYTHNTKA
ncbi:MAG TPA: pyridoxamine 5'-phosphate oxidase family protein, partial [Chloroflexota bacterium]|nr:pyridoxamine 5'-phosphate oxidase family protein [Chloroflexota bacterium]